MSTLHNTFLPVDNAMTMVCPIWSICCLQCMFVTIVTVHLQAGLIPRGVGDQQDPDSWLVAGMGVLWSKRW